MDRVPNALSSLQLVVLYVWGSESEIRERLFGTYATGEHAYKL